MMKDIPPSLLGENLPLYFIREYIRRARDYMAIYHEGHKKGEVWGGSVLAKLKEEYKSHRRPSPLESMMQHRPRKPWAIKKMLVEGGKLRQPCSVATAVAAGVATMMGQEVEKDDMLEQYGKEDDVLVAENGEDYEEEVGEEDEAAFDREYDDE